jgi:phage terminase large subunit GpA-like protein
MRQPYSWSQIDNFPGTNKPIAGGLKLLRVWTTHYKNKLASVLKISIADPGAWKYHSETTAEWATQMTAEYVGDDGFWDVKSGRANHAWDCSVLNLCAADMLGVWFRNRPEPRAQHQTGNIERHGGSEKWLNPSANWMKK